MDASKADQELRLSPNRKPRGLSPPGLERTFTDLCLQKYVVVVVVVVFFFFFFVFFFFVVFFVFGFF